MKRQSDFNWYAEIPLLSQWEHRQLTVIVEAFFNNGEGRRSRRSFFYEKPVIVTNVGCFPEYVEDGVDGIVVPALDVVALQQALEKLLENTELRNTMGRNGFKKLSVKFSNDRITKEYISIFKSIFNG